jgi:sterol desaturase/sphingolipid hydroxylase (fatty acid hydroxylase superfamily)
MCPLWRLHAVHHGVQRLYGFNGLVRHPLHQQLDLAIGTLPLVLAGMPLEVAVLLGLAITIQLIVQHSNIDYALGPFRQVLSIGATHRLHHVHWDGENPTSPIGSPTPISAMASARPSVSTSKRPDTTK